jgi:CBS domain-containing protein
MCELKEKGVYVHQQIFCSFSAAAESFSCLPGCATSVFTGMHSIFPGGTMEHVTDILHEKGDTVWTISPDAPVRDALALFAEKNIGALLAATSEGEIAGIFSERDFARYCAEHGDVSLDTPIHKMMQRSVVYIRSDQSVDNCMALMTDKRIRHLPVIDDGRLKGLISIGDVVKAEIHEKDILIDQLEHYIVSSM